MPLAVTRFFFENTGLESSHLTVEKSRFRTKQVRGTTFGWKRDSQGKSHGFLLFPAPR